MTLTRTRAVVRDWRSSEMCFCCFSRRESSETGRVNLFAQHPALNNLFMYATTYRRFLLLFLLL